eukprot:GHVS01092289.1.p1 GENE.GHVS01092289.1~~GHVS01092289.1.p1  ORF type:complete len:121 (-),score=33.77 GHVS01092289.1:39-401(-)
MRHCDCNSDTCNNSNSNNNNNSATAVDAVDEMRRRKSERIKLTADEIKHQQLRCDSLSELSRKVLGHSLCKQLQQSDWNKRPLSQAQLDYAALDALVLQATHQQLTREGWRPSRVINPIG